NDDVGRDEVEDVGGDQDRGDEAERAQGVDDRPALIARSRHVESHRATRQAGRPALRAHVVGHGSWAGRHRPADVLPSALREAPSWAGGFLWLFQISRQGSRRIVFVNSRAFAAVSARSPFSPVRSFTFASTSCKSWNVAVACSETSPTVGTRSPTNAVPE